MSGYPNPSSSTFQGTSIETDSTLGRKGMRKTEINRTARGTLAIPTCAFVNRVALVGCLQMGAAGKRG